MAPAYLISLEPEDGYADHDWVAEYAENVVPMVAAFGGEHLVRYQPTRVLEGDWDPGPIVLLRFPSMERLMAFYESDEYRPWRELRKGAGAGRLVAFES